MVKEKEFIANFAEQFEDYIPVLTLNTSFRTVDGWSSLIALSVMAMCTEKYNVTIAAEEMEKAEKVSDIYDIVNSRYNG